MEQLKGYLKSISEATGVTNVADLNEIEDYMRNVYFHSTLDWQSEAQFNKGARESWADIQWSRTPEGKKYIAELERRMQG